MEGGLEVQTSEVGFRRLSLVSVMLIHSVYTCSLCFYPSVMTQRDHKSHIVHS